MPKKSESEESARSRTSDKPQAPRPPRKRVSRASAAADETMQNIEPSSEPGKGAAQHREESAEERFRRIALDAYYRAEQRGFAPGGELDDWLAAENQAEPRSGE